MQFWKLQRMLQAIHFVTLTAPLAPYITLEVSAKHVDQDEYWTIFSNRLQTNI